MAVKFEINITEKSIYSLLALAVLLSLGIGVYAYNSGSDPSVMGHSGEELEVDCPAAGGTTDLNTCVDSISSKLNEHSSKLDELSSEQVKIRTWQRTTLLTTGSTTHNHNFDLSKNNVYAFVASLGVRETDKNDEWVRVWISNREWNGEITDGHIDVEYRTKSDARLSGYTLTAIAVPE